MKKYWKLVLCLVIAFLLAWGLWYARPVDIYALEPGLGELQVINVFIDQHASPGTVSPSRQQAFTPEAPEWEAVLAEVEALRFRRPPWNLILQFLDQNTVPVHSSYTGAYTTLIKVRGEDGRNVGVQFCTREWLRFSLYSNRNLELWMRDGEEIGIALSERLWSLMPETADQAV